MWPHQVTTSVWASTASVRPWSGWSSVAVRTATRSPSSAVRPAAIAACIPSGYSARTCSSSRSCTFSPHTVTRIGSLTTGSVAEACSEQAADALDRGLAEHDLQEHAGDADGDAQHDHEEVLEQHSQREQDDAECRQRVQSREGRREEGARAPGDDQEAEDDVAQPVVEEEGQARAREALEEADEPHEARDEAPLARAGQLQPAPALGQPDVLATGDELQGEQHGDDLEDVGCASGRQRQGRDA